MFADRRRVELAGSIHLVFPLPQNAFPYPRKEAAPFGKYISVTCPLPEVLILESWEGKRKQTKEPTSLQSVHLDKTQGMTTVGRDLSPFKELIRTASSKLVKGPQLQRRNSCQVFLLVRVSEWFSFVNVPAWSEDKGEGRGVNS